MSGKQSKRRRREAQLRVPQPAHRRASPRVLVAGAVVLGAVAAAIALAAALGGHSRALRHALPGATQVRRVFDGIPQDGNVLGSPSAPATLVEYVDLQCPYCREFDTQTLPALVSRYVRRGKLKIELRPIAFIGPDSERGRAAAIAAAHQDRMFDFTGLLYFNQGPENTGWLDDELVEAAAASIPRLDVRLLLRDRTASPVADEARRFDERERSMIGV